MKNVLKAVLIFMSFNYVMGNTYKHCQTLHGELEFIHPIKSSHIFIAPHSLTSNQRQIASLKAQEKNDVIQWETLHFKSHKSEYLWSQKNLNFKSNFTNYIEISLNDGKTHTFSLSCTEF